MWTEDGKQYLSGRGQNRAPRRSSVSVAMVTVWGRAFQLLEARVQVSEFLLERELAAEAGRVITITFAARPMRIFLENGAQPSRLRLAVLEL